MTRRYKIIAASIAVVVACAILLAFLFGRAVSVEVALREPNVRAAVYGLGTVEARILSRIGFDVPGILAELNADHGDLVKAGDVLARLQSFKQESRVNKAKAGLANSEAALLRAQAAADKATTLLAQRKRTNQRRQSLLGKQFVSEEAAQQSQMDEDVAVSEIAVSRADIEVAKSLVKDAQAQYEYESRLLMDHALRAPYDALVITRHKELGSALGSSEALFTLVEPKTVWILAYIDESRAGPIRLDQHAIIRLRSLPGQSFKGKVTRIGFESDRVTEERRVYVSCGGCPEALHLGEQAEVEIETASLADALLIPEAAITQFDGAKGKVWTIEDGLIRQREFRFGHRTLDGRAQLVSDLSKGVSIIIKPSMGLQEGWAAKITNGKAP